MKKLLFAAAFLFTIFSASAQQKIGYISTDELIGSMPELAKIDTELKQYQQELAEQGESYMGDYRAKDSAYAKDSSKLSPTMKNIKRNELGEIYQKIVGWQQQMQVLYEQRTQEKLAPVRTKALDAIKAVAKENNYAYVLDITAVIVAPPGDDILALVRKKLGIAAPAAAPKR